MRLSVVTAREATIGHVKAIHPEGRHLDVNPLDEGGNAHEVTAIEQTGNPNVLDVKAFVGNRVLPVKVLASDD